MAVNTSTPKARAFGRTLREVREARKVSLRVLAAKLGRDASQLSRWESGYRVPKETDVAQLLAHLGVSGEQCEKILEMCSGAYGPHWRVTGSRGVRQQLASLVEYENAADSITEVTPLLMPGLLQTTAYARSMMSAGDVPVEEIETRVAVRVGRRDVLTRPQPAHYTVFVGEAALRHTIGSHETMLEQLAFLQTMSKRSNVELRVVSFDTGWTPALEGVFLLLDTEPVPVVHIENRRSGLFLHEPDDVAIYRDAAATVQEAALAPAQSMGFIEQLVRDREARL